MEQLKEIMETMKRLEEGVIKEEQVVEIVKSQMAEMSQSKVVFSRERGEDNRTEYGKQFKGFADFLKSTIGNDGRVQKAISMQTEGTDADGGYVVPDEYEAMIIGAIQSNGGIARRLASILPMTRKTRNIPKSTTTPTVYWADEAGAYTEFKLTLAQLAQTARKLTALVVFSQELIADDTPDLDVYIANLVGNAFALEEDRMILAGDSAGTDFMDGVINDSNVTEVTKAGGSLVADDLITQYSSLNETVAPNASWIVNKEGLAKVMKLRDSNGQPLYQRLQDGPGLTLLGRPVNMTSVIPNTLGAGSDTAIIFGDYKRGLIVSPRAGIITQTSREATLNDAGTPVSAFERDLVISKWSERLSLDIAQPDAMNFMVI